MIKLEKPDIDVESIITDCIANLTKQPILTHINASHPTIVLKSEKYNELAEKGQLGTLETHTIVEGGATKDDMVWLYDNKFVADGGRKYYDKIKSIPKYSKCPFCGVGTVSTLDHYLPKTKYPTYAVTPVNLIACCADCNKKKKSEISETRNNEFIHPYYDDFNDEVWLKVKIVFDEEIIFSFYVEKPNTWEQEKYERAKNHLKKLQLNKLYVAHCGEEFSEYGYTAKGLYKRGGEELVREDLICRIEERRRVTKNNWRAALYEGLLESQDFFDKYLMS
ncbi:hypothetical protein DW918_02485 [Eubacterium ventriosum]|jgi:hypothetical protein|uniref:HNH endonuclease n=1 Tax=Eubacterium ventriosum TaxID=39496 RepID=A0A413T9B4_9FIRM|nr:hypothetical protein DW918_02485 [Eubacterium ventriosum]